MLLLAAGALTLVLPDPVDEPSRAAGRVDPDRAAALAAYQRMTPRQRVGQLFMIGVDAGGATSSQRREIAHLALGNVFLRGRSDAGVRRTATLTRSLDERATRRGVRPLVAVDQEGGLVQTLTGPGFSTIPTGTTQGRLTPDRLRRQARGWGAELDRAGVNLDLAPVADVVPSSIGDANAPIGRYQRELGHTPVAVGEDVTRLVRGLDAAGVASTLKHFPGLGRATDNTDSSTGVTAPTTRKDADLTPFRAGVRAGADVVMMSSARYPRIDPDQLACYSPVAMRTMLRRDLGFEGIVISDSFSTPALAGRVPAARAVRFLSAGGTMVLDTDPDDLRPMSNAVLARTRADPAFAVTVRRAVLQVLRVKVERALVRS